MTSPFLGETPRQIDSIPSSDTNPDFEPSPVKSAGLKGEVSLKRLIRGRAIAARVVQLHGEKYLPIFQKIDDEIRAWSAKELSLEKALKIAEEFQA